MDSTVLLWQVLQVLGRIMMSRAEAPTTIFVDDPCPWCIPEVFTAAEISSSRTQARSGSCTAPKRVSQGKGFKAHCGGDARFRGVPNRPRSASEI